MLSAAVHHLAQTNVLTPDPVDPTFSIQNGEVVSKGTELEARLDVGAVGLVAAHACTDAETTKSMIPAS